MGPQGLPGAAGPAGAQGVPGQQGVPGEQGPAAIIEVGTVSVSTDGSASVVNSGTSTHARFDFLFPSARGLHAFGGRYNNTVGSTDMAEDVPTVVAMPYTQSTKNITYPIANSMTVAEAGAYLLLYSAYPRFNAPATLTFAVRSNGIALPSTQNVVTVTAAAYSVNYVGNTLVDLPAGAVVDIAITSSADQTMSFSNQSLNSLILMKLN